jgi:hypothetical protein
VLTRTVDDPRMRRAVVFAAGTLAVATLSSLAPAPDLAPAAAATSTTSSAQTAGAVAATAAARVVATSAPRPRAAAPVVRKVAPRAVVPFRFGSPAYSQWWARRLMATRYSWRSSGQFQCLVQLWNRESHWNYRSHNRSSGAHGIPQALPGAKMARVGRDWRTNPVTQIRWGLGYIKGAYGSPCGAWGHWRSHGWY